MKVGTGYIPKVLLPHLNYEPNVQSNCPIKHHHLVNIDTSVSWDVKRRLIKPNRTLELVD